MTPACGARSFSASARTVLAVRIHVASTVLDLVPNKSARFIAYAIDRQGVYTDITSQAEWSTSNAKVLTVTPGQGAAVVRTVSPGDARVIASFHGQRDSATLRVYREPRSAPRIEIETTGSLPTIDAGRAQTTQLQIRSYPLSGLPQIVTAASTITTSNPGIAVVTGGRLRPISTGIFRITATYNGMTATALSSVPPPVQR